MHRLFMFPKALLLSMVVFSQALADRSIISGRFASDDPVIERVEEHEFCPFDDDLPYQVLGPLTVDATDTYEVRDTGGFTFWGQQTVLTYYDGEPDVDNPLDNRIGTTSGGRGSVLMEEGKEYWVLAQPFCRPEYPEAHNGMWAQHFSGDGTLSGPQVVIPPRWWSGRWSDSDPLAPDIGGSPNCPDTFYDVSGPHRFDRAGTWYIATTSGFDYASPLIGLYDAEFDPDNPQANQLALTVGGAYPGIETDKDYWFVVQPACDVATDPWYFTMWRPAPYELNAAAGGTYYNRETDGQGQLVDIDPVTGFVFMAWFTWAKAPEIGESGLDAVGDPDHRWFTASGNYAPGDSGVDLVIYNSTGGVFDDPATVQTDQAGTGSLEFSDCETGELNFELDSGEQDTVPMERLLTGNVPRCEANFAGAEALHVQ